MRRAGRRAPAAMAALGWAFVASVAAAQSDPCDPRLARPADDPFGYRLLVGDGVRRCEGRYVRQVATTTLAVASLTESFAPYDPESAASLEVGWAEPVAKQLHLRARGLRPRLFYRMDAVVPGDESPVRWPTDVITGLRILPAELGIVGWFTDAVGGVARDVYLPLRVGAAGATAAGSADVYRLVLLPGEELEEVYVSLAPVGNDGRPETFLLDGEALGYGFYPAGQGTEVILEGLREPGTYYLEIGATLAGGGSVSLELWLRHAG